MARELGRRWGLMRRMARGFKARAICTFTDRQQVEFLDRHYPEMLGAEFSRLQIPKRQRVARGILALGKFEELSPRSKKPIVRMQEGTSGNA